MNGKDFHKRFEEFFNQFFNQDNQKFNTPMDGFLKALNPDDISKEMKKYRKSIKESNDGLFTTISFIFTNPPFSDKSEANELKSKLDECVSNQDFEEAARLRDKIKELEMVLNELDPAYKILQPFYEPKIDISLSESRGENVYVGSVFVVPGDRAMKRRIKFVINPVNYYKDINDERLLEDAKSIARQELIRFFPTYFEKE